jgi:hypothetical protein
LFLIRDALVAHKAGNGGLTLGLHAIDDSP